jgi:diguanylate cyclase (GGDEF)-like protein/PAS domain S-box-containing protein
MYVDNAFYKEMLDALYDGVYFMDRDRIIRYWNRGAELLTGYEQDEVLGRPCRDNLLNHVDEEGRALCDTELCPAMKSMMDGKGREAEIFLHHKAGYRLPIITRISPIRSPEGEIIGAVEIFTDNRQMHWATERIKELERLALLDPLTKIGNRRYAEAHVEVSLSQLDRYGWVFGVLLIAVDQLSQVNETYGHETGDRVLETVANTIIHNVRTSDIASRWAGGEFLIIVPTSDARDLESLGRKLLNLIHEARITAWAGTLRSTVSIGATIARAGDSLSTLISRSNRLMEESKLRGRNRVTIDLVP